MGKLDTNKCPKCGQLLSIIDVRAGRATLKKENGELVRRRGIYLYMFCWSCYTCCMRDWTDDIGIWGWIPDCATRCTHDATTGKRCYSRRMHSQISASSSPARGSSQRRLCSTLASIMLAGLLIAGGEGVAADVQHRPEDPLGPELLVADGAVSGLVKGLEEVPLQRGTRQLVDRLEIPEDRSLHSG